MATGNRFRGLVSQGLAGRKDYSGMPIEFLGVVSAKSGSGVVIAPKACLATIFAWGGGGSGGAGAGTDGGCGAALMRRLRLAKGQQIAYTVGIGGRAAPDGIDGAPGSDTTVTLPDGQQLVAGAGGMGLYAGAAPGVPGIAYGVAKLRQASVKSAGGFPEYGPMLAGGALGSSGPGAGSFGASGGLYSANGGPGQCIIVLTCLR